MNWKNLSKQQQKNLLLLGLLALLGVALLLAGSRGGQSGSKRKAVGCWAKKKTY